MILPNRTGYERNERAAVIYCRNGSVPNRKLAIGEIWTPTSLISTETDDFPPETSPVNQTVNEHCPAISPEIQTWTVDSLPETSPAIRIATEHSPATLPANQTATSNHSSISPDYHSWTFAPRDSHCATSPPEFHSWIVISHYLRKPATVTGTVRNAGTRRHFRPTVGKHSIRNGNVANQPGTAIGTCPTRELVNLAAIRPRNRIY